MKATISGSFKLPLIEDSPYQQRSTVLVFALIERTSTPVDCFGEKIFLNIFQTIILTITVQAILLGSAILFFLFQYMELVYLHLFLLVFETG
ncbi:hypothetical protein SAMN05216179_1273 [Gracilibacillus kekensis]|uniref:Uncharacterized protein n=1 Tax=Gracilibacillus kekensis TaxID=1027249 RepID=A0A1M7MLN7_9BACI|nr:hypothetical protein SAMN05216179_1273 [Gracilibacillus kekensis]